MIRRLALIFTALIACALLAAGYLVRRQLPDHAAPPLGLRSEARVRFDARAVPTIEAQDFSDALRVQGYLVARERMFQLELQRRAAEGRLAELVGPAALPIDRTHRLYGFRQVAEAAVPLLPAEERANLEAYAAGVNAFLASHPGRHGLELQLLGIAPAPWTPANTVEVLLLMHEDLASGWKQELRHAALQGLSDEQRRFLEPRVTDRDVLLIPDASPAPPADEQAIFAAAAQEQPEAPGARQPVLPSVPSPQPLAASAGEPAPDTGSNSWVVSGARTASGKPLLANDPHLDLTEPGIWLPMRIELPGRYVQGVALAGVPGITIGNNDRVAWGYTNLGTDVSDLFREEATSSRVEEIAVKGAAADSFRVLVGPHGPQVSPGYSLKWAALDPRNLRLPFARIDLARDWASFNDAFDGYFGPAQNVVYADVDGHIGWRATGLLPLRPDGDDGSSPRDGARDWRGYLPQSEMPRVIDPPSGYLATANQRIIGTSFPHVVATNWASPTRARRIASLIEAAGKLDREGIERMQLDVVSTDHLELVKAFPDPQRFAGWTGEAGADSKLFLEAWAFEAAVRELIRKQLLGAAAEGFSWSNDSATLRALATADAAAFQRAGLGDRAAFFAEARARGEAWLREQRESEWGAWNALHIVHPFGRAGGPLGLLFNPPSAPQSGASRTVRVARPHNGQSMRFICDLSAPLEATLVVPLGVSGHLGSAHRTDEQRDWLQGDPGGVHTRLRQEAVRGELVFGPNG